jgi:prepilin-type N-terminal cleavage/methylation domain-containing protein
MIGRRLLQRGDTIVEVLISIAIISLVLAGAYAASSRNTSLIEAAQEREQAQRLVEAQIENIRSHNGITGASVCFVSGVEKPSTDTGCLNQSATFSGATYKMQITTSPSDPKIYIVQAKWTSQGSKISDDSKVTMYYRLTL